MTNSVELIGYYGGDQSHSLSAWTSTSRDLTNEKRARIPALLKMLAENGHETPFEKSTLHFLVTCDTASHIHILKHRIGVSVNGESARYKELKEDKYHVPDDWDVDSKLLLEDHCKLAFARYHLLVEKLTPTLGRKRAKESARFVLPYANQLQLDVSFNFRSFMHFLRLRYTEHAQCEIYWVAEAMLEKVRGLGCFEHSLKGFGYGS